MKRHEEDRITGVPAGFLFMIFFLYFLYTFGIIILENAWILY